MRYLLALRRRRDDVALGASDHGHKVAPAIVVVLRDDALLTKAAVNALKEEVMVVVNVMSFVVSHMRRDTGRKGGHGYTALCGVYSKRTRCEAGSTRKNLDSSVPRRK